MSRFNRGQPPDSENQKRDRRGAGDPSISYEDDTLILSRELDDDPFGGGSPDPYGIWGRVKPVKRDPDGSPGPETAPRPTPSTVHTSVRSIGTSSKKPLMGCPICRLWPCSCGAERRDGKDPYSGTGNPPQGSAGTKENIDHTPRESRAGQQTPLVPGSTLIPQASGASSGSRRQLEHHEQRRTSMRTNTRLNEYFVPRDGIDRDVITADIVRYLGNDALVRPGTYENDSQVINGYYITAPRNLTSAMIADLKADTTKWDQERRKSMRHGSWLRYPGSDAPGYSAGGPSFLGSGLEVIAQRVDYTDTGGYPAGAGLSTGAPSGLSVLAYDSLRYTSRPPYDLNYTSPSVQTNSSPGYSAQSVSSFYGRGAYASQPVDAYYGRGDHTGTSSYPTTSSYSSTSNQQAFGSYSPPQDNNTDLPPDRRVQ